MYQNKKWHYLFVALLIGLIAINSAFAKTKKDEMAEKALLQAQLAIDEAVEANCQDFSPIELRFANEKLVAAHEAFENKKWQRASFLANESQVNSELAIAKTRAAKVREVNQQIYAEINMLREELQALN